MRWPQILPSAERIRPALVREVREARDALRSAPRGVVARELAFFLVVLAIGFVQLWLSPPSPGRVAAIVASACWAALLVPARRRWPAATMLATAPVFAGGNIGALVFLPAVTFSAARRIRPARRLWTTVLLTAAADALLQLAAEINEPHGFGELFAGYAVSVVLLLLLPALTGGLLGRRRPLVRVLRERNDYLERAQVLTGEKARMKERARIAAEMHDLLGHRLSLISMHAGALELTTADKAPELSGQAELLRTTAATAMTELREILEVLRDTMDTAPGAVGERTGTRADVADLVDGSRRAGIDVDLAWSGADLDSADSRTRHAVHRVVREGLTNVHKHAPAARTRVEVTGGADRVRVCVTNGPVRGAAPRLPGTRQGLVGLEERVALLRGAFTAGPTPEGGFHVMAVLPPHPPVPASAPADLGTLRDEPERPAPLDAEVLTLPRVLGAGCLGLLATVPVAAGTAILIIAWVLE
ncbi:sensor histidine kinase [Spirillospora sp. CA-294931]|uniref:sensor histidine kinase n=1 Tax=Spirillospora sp. CA-294931 TaxID=3240042 RepID=UPI003D8E2E26